jgi:hypothetical protein
MSAKENNVIRNIHILKRKQNFMNLVGHEVDGCHNTNHKLRSKTWSNKPQMVMKQCEFKLAKGCRRKVFQLDHF